jgi:dephospho-CoA kinase
MLIIGLTGGIGSGKTTVSGLFGKLGVPVIDTDVIARELVEQNTDVLQDITGTFGNAVLNSDGTLDRKILAGIVFHDKDARQKLENILHPRIRNKVSSIIRTYQSRAHPPQYVLVVIPLLLETGFRELIDRILVVISDEETRIKRIRQRDNRSDAEIRSIINSQVSDKTRINEADDVIDNNLKAEDLEPRISELHQKYSSLGAAITRTK